MRSVRTLLMLSRWRFLMPSWRSASEVPGTGGAWHVQKSNGSARGSDTPAHTGRTFPRFRVAVCALRSWKPHDAWYLVRAGDGGGSAGLVDREAWEADGAQERVV